MRTHQLLVWFILVGVLSSCSAKESDIDDNNNPSGNNKELTVTGDASSITEISAILSGYANPTTDMGTITMGILYSQNDNPTLENSIMLSSRELDKNNMYSVKASNLVPECTYYFKSYIQAGGVYRSGEVKSFRTKAVSATVTTIEATEISFSSGLLHGHLEVSTTEELSTQVGFLTSTVNTSLESIIAENHQIKAAIFNDGSYSVNLSTGQYGQTIYYVAYAIVAGKSFYGEVKHFSTDTPQATIENNGASSTGVTKATLQSTVYTDNSQNLDKTVWFVYSENENTKDGLLAKGIHAHATVSGDGVYTSDIAKLKYNTTYYCIACLQIYDIVFYSEIKSFTTTDFAAFVETKEAEDIEDHKASVHGTLTIESEEHLDSEVFFLYSSTANTIEGLKSAGIRVSATLDNSHNFSAALNNLEKQTTYYYLACSNVIGKEILGEVKSFTTLLRIVPAGAVELGLSVMWGECNLGATSEEEYGNYYAWGETIPGSYFSYAAYKWCGDTYNSLIKYNYNPDYGVVDNKTTLDASDDAASVSLKNKWRMPTRAELKELIDKCTWSWTSRNGVNGYEVTSGINGNKIFLPANGMGNNDAIEAQNRYGYYWTSTLSNLNPGSAYSLLFYSETHYCNDSASRYAGMAIRPVTE